MDFVLDYISVTTFWTILLIIHGLLAVTLLGALTHQAMSVLMPVRRVAGAGGPGFVTRFRAVHGAGYAVAVCVLWILTFIFGAWIYTKYRIYVRIPIEQQGFWKTQGVFELKEHIATIGLGLLPIYWYLLEECRQSRIRKRPQMADRVSRRHVLVRLPCRPHRQQCPGIRIMSTTTETTPVSAAVPSRASTSLASSAKFKTFAIVFGVATAVLYVICDMMALPLFTYHPGTDRIELGWAPRETGRGAGDVLVWLDRNLDPRGGRPGRGLPRCCPKTWPRRSRCPWCGSSRSWRRRF